MPSDITSIMPGRVTPAQASPRGDWPFYAGLTVLGGFYAALILALVLADVAYLSSAGGLIAPFAAVLRDPDIRFSLVLTLVSCAVSAALSVLVAVPLGYALSRTRFWGKGLVEALVDIPIVLPPLVLGLSLLILFQSPAGRWMEQLAEEYLPGAALVLLAMVLAGGAAGCGLLWRRASARRRRAGAAIAGTAVAVLGVLYVANFAPLRATFTEYLGSGMTYAVPAVVLAQFVAACAFAVRTMRITFDQISPRTEQVALTLGCNRSQAFWRVVMPESWRATVAAGTLAWARSLGEFGPILVFAGATARRTEVLSTSVFLQLSMGNVRAAVAISLLMILVAISVLLLVRMLAGRPLAGRVL